MRGLLVCDEVDHDDVCRCLFEKQRSKRRKDRVTANRNFVNQDQNDRVTVRVRGSFHCQLSGRRTVAIGDRRAREYHSFSLPSSEQLRGQQRVCMLA